MLSPEIQRKIRKLKIVTKGLMEGPLTGDDVSAHRGYGVEFHQIREYQFGDDVRFIDWKSSCRLNKMFVKECLEERNRRVILAIDISGTSFYGSAVVRFEKIKEIATVLAFASHYAKDSVGLILFADDIEFIVEAKSTEAHLHFLLQRLYEYQPQFNRGTKISSLLDYVAQKWYKDAILFVISDFIDDHFEESLRAAAARVDLVAIRCYDPVEHVLPPVGFLMVEDVESGQSLYVESNPKSSVARLLKDRVIQQNKLFLHAGVDVLDVSYQYDSCARLIEFFKKRMFHMSMK